MTDSKILRIKAGHLTLQGKTFTTPGSAYVLVAGPRATVNEKAAPSHTMIMLGDEDITFTAAQIIIVGVHKR